MSEFEYDFNLIRSNVEIPSLSLNLPFPYPRSTSEIIETPNYVVTPLEFVNKVIDHYNFKLDKVVVRIPVSKFVLAPELRLKEIERKINIMINKIFQENPSLP